MAILSLTELESGSAITLVEEKIIRASEKLVDAVSKTEIEYVTEADGIKKKVVVDETFAAVSGAAAHLFPVTLFASTTPILLSASRVALVEDVLSKVDDTTTVGEITYDAAGAISEKIETVQLNAVIAPLVGAALVA